MVVYVCIKRNRGALTVKNYSDPYTMSGLSQERGINNPLAGSDIHINAEGDHIYDSGDKVGLVNNL